LWSSSLQICGETRTHIVTAVVTCYPTFTTVCLKFCNLCFLFLLEPLLCLCFEADLWSSSSLQICGETRTHIVTAVVTNMQKFAVLIVESTIVGKVSAVIMYIGKSFDNNGPVTDILSTFYGACLVQCVNFMLRIFTVWGFTL